MSSITNTTLLVYSESELVDLLRNYIHDDQHDSVVIMAGHFMLFYDSATRSLVPGIFEDIEHERLREQVKGRVGIFPSYTWDLGVRLGDDYHEICKKPAKLLLLVNDWQYVPDAGSAAEYRAEFYRAFERLPPTYIDRLSRSSVLSERDVIPSRRHSIAFPETWLRYRFQNKATQLVKAGKLQKRHLEEKPGQSEVSYTSTTGASLPLISCGVTGCAGEIVEMISEVHRAGGRFLIVLAPGECHAPIRAGIEIALSIYELRGMKVLVADPGGSGEMSLNEIYGKGVNVAIFQS